MIDGPNPIHGLLYIVEALVRTFQVNFTRTKSKDSSFWTNIRFEKIMIYERFIPVVPALLQHETSGLRKLAGSLRSLLMHLFPLGSEGLQPTFCFHYFNYSHAFMHNISPLAREIARLSHLTNV